MATEAGRERLTQVRQDPPADGPANMAEDLGLLRRAVRGEAGARVYSWDGVWVSLGFNQVPDRDLLHAGNTPHVMRPTGGKAVLHGHDATVGLALPLAALGEDSARSVKRVYRAIARPLALALSDCGLPAVLAESVRVAEGEPDSPDCFSHVSPNDIVDPATGVKVCGCALRVLEGAVLLQASIPARDPDVDPATLFRHPHVPHIRAWNVDGLREALERRLRG